jgi:hypothetical protein
VPLNRRQNLPHIASALSQKQAASWPGLVAAHTVPWAWLAQYGHVQRVMFGLLPEIVMDGYREKRRN